MDTPSGKRKLAPKRKASSDITETTTTVTQAGLAMDLEYAGWLSSISSILEDENLFEARRDSSCLEEGTYASFLYNLPSKRKSDEAKLRSLFAGIQPQPSIFQWNYTIRSYDMVSIGIVRFGPAKTETGLQPALLFLHGGGMIAGSIAVFAPRIAELAALSGVQVVAVEYRLAPEYPYPTPLEDAYAGLKWLQRNARSLGIDAQRIGIMGESSGGGLAAGVALRARGEALKPAIKKLILIYPMLDDRSIVKWPKTRENVLLSNCWRAYLGEAAAGKAGVNVLPYAAAARAVDLSGLPGTYLEVGGLDSFRDECISFAGRLAAAGNTVEFHLWPGVPHGFDMARGIGVTERAMESRIRAIKEI